MLKKLKNNSGLSLIEMLVAIGILVILIVGMESGISAGTRAYSESMFQSNCSQLTGILNSAMGDALRNSETVVQNPQFENPRSHGFRDEAGDFHTKDEIPFVFSNYEGYGIRNGYFVVEQKDATDKRQVLKMRDLQNNPPMELINVGAYTDLEIYDFKITIRDSGECFDIEYYVRDINDAERKSDKIIHTVRLLNHLEK